MKEIKSINNELIKSLNKLKDKKERLKQKKFIVEGYHLVNEAYKTGALLQVFTINSNDNYNVESYLVNEDIIKKLSLTMNPQGIIGICEIENSNEMIGNRYLILDNVNDPGNMGTLIRSSLGFNIDTIILSTDCVDIYNDKVIRASQGAIFYQNIVICNLEHAIKKLKDNDVQIIGTSLKSSVNLRSIKNKSKYAIILGNEANGIRQNILDMTDVNVKIEISEKLESLNVAVAGSVIMYYLNK